MSGLQLEELPVRGTTLSSRLGKRAHLLSPEVNLNTRIQDVTGLLEAEELNGVVLPSYLLLSVAARMLVAAEEMG